jgi:DNA-binding CsgD family transcriptional regulator
MLRDCSEIVRLIKKGATTKAIAEHYGIHQVSIQQHIRETVGDNVMLILKANSRAALVAGRKRQLKEKNRSNKNE